MATDIVGPTNAPNTVTVRPADTRTGFGATDSWFKDCTSALTNDGTRVMAGWLNATIGQFRTAIRGNGNTGGGSAIVAEDNSDGMLLTAIKHLIQRGQPQFAVDTSNTSNLVTVSLSPAAAEYKPGMTLRVVMAAAPTGPSVINVNGLGGKSIVKGGLQALAGFEWAAGDVVSLTYDGTNFQISNVRGPVYLSAPQTYYVNGSTGSDSNNGLTTGTAFATIGRALTASTSFNLNGFSVTINVADSTYTSSTYISLPPVNGSGTIFITGNTTTPANCIVTNNGTGGVFESANGTGGAGTYDIKGFKLNATGSTVAGQINALIGSSAATVLASSIVCGASPGPHFGANITGQVLISGNITVTAGAQYHMFGSEGGKVLSNIGASPTEFLSISNAVTFSGAFAGATALGQVRPIFNTITGGASVTGKRYDAQGNGVVNTGGAGATYLPGTVAGTTSTGGQYF